MVGGVWGFLDLLVWYILVFEFVLFVIFIGGVVICFVWSIVMNILDFCFLYVQYDLDNVEVECEWFIDFNVFVVMLYCIGIGVVVDGQFWLEWY